MLELKEFILLSFASSGTLLKAIWWALIGLLVAKILRRRVSTYLQKHAKDPTLILFLVNSAYISLLIVVGIVILSVLGVPTASMIALLGAGGLAIGFALKDSLSNVASGLLLVFLQPFRIGDSVEISGTQGVVEKIELFTTLIKTEANEYVYFPNRKIFSDKIINRSYQ